MLESPAARRAKFNEDAVRETLGRILKSKPFSGSPRLSDFLRYVVEHTLYGDVSSLKETCIGVAVFGKVASYDPKEEPIVRVEARRLRARLEEYYSSAGSLDPVRITLPKGGYLAAFEEPGLATLETTITPAPVETTVRFQGGASPPPPLRTTRHPHWFFLIVIAAGLAAAGVSTFFIRRLSPSPRLQFSRVGPLAHYPGNEFQPAISHDGKHLAFSWKRDKEDDYNLYVKLVDLGSPVRLTSDSGHDLSPQWSPDDRFISFLRVSEQGTGLYILPSLGGTERKIADIHVGLWAADALQIDTDPGAVWSSDGATLITGNEEDPGAGTIALFAIPLDGSPRRRITSPPNLARDLYAAVSPDGRSLAFLRETSHSSGDVFVSDVDGKHLRQITFDRMRVRGITWAAHGRTLVFASNRGGADGLWQVSAGGGIPERIPTKGNEVSWPSVSLDGTMLAYTSITANSNIWRLETASPSAHPELLIECAGRNNSPRYSPDGKKIAFTSDRSGTWELWVADSDGQEVRQLTNFGGPMVGTPNWSPDSLSLVFDARPNGRSIIYTIPVNGSTPQAIIYDQFENKKPNWSRDGQSIYYTSNRDGFPQLWRSGFHGEHPIKLTSVECNDSAESMDGKYIYFQADSRGIYRMPSAGGAPELVKGLETVYPSRYFDVSDQIYFLDQESAPRLIRRYDPGTQTISTVGKIEHQLVYGPPGLSISPDHQHLIFAQQDNITSEIMALHK
jgi:Tol biopolymer transport system component